MGYVRIPVSFKGMGCDDCEFETTVDSAGIEFSNFCSLFQKAKQEGERCSDCLFFELRKDTEEGRWVERES